LGVGPEAAPRAEEARTGPGRAAATPTQARPQREPRLGAPPELRGQVVGPIQRHPQVPRGDVEARVRAELGRRVVGWTELGTGANNRLFRLDLAAGPPLLAKAYARGGSGGSNTLDWASAEVVFVQLAAADAGGASGGGAAR
jgi:hypothetical protein